MKPKTYIRNFFLAVATCAVPSMSLHAATIDLDLTTNNTGAITLASGNNTFSFSGFEVDYLIVAGGGAGGTTGRSSTSAGGGGAGGLLQGTGLSISGAQEIEVGEGGEPSGSRSVPGFNGGNSKAFGLEAIGGGGGGSSTLDAGQVGRDGGSGGGAARGDQPAGSGTTGQGNDGSKGTSDSVGGGGGGAGTAGSPLTGGAGLELTITGTSQTFAAGGNAGAGTSNNPGTPGADNTGNGGGGAWGQTSTSPNDGSAGGSGIVVVRYSGPQVLAGGVFSTVGGDTVHQFLDTGTSTLDLYSATVGGDISGDGNLIWDKTGTLTLGGTNTYTGTTTINLGTILLTGSIESTSDLIVGNGGFLNLGSSGVIYVLQSNYSITDADNDILAGLIFGADDLVVSTVSVGSDDFTQISVIPEPRAALLGSLGLLILLRRRR